MGFEFVLKIKIQHMHSNLDQVTLNRQSIFVSFLSSAWIMDRIYDKPYCRVAPYLIGIFLGYMFSRYDVKRTHKTCPGKLVLLGWLVATAVGISVVYGPWHVFKPDGWFFTDVENVLYGACSRVGWGMSVAWVVWACHNRVGGVVNSLLSWRAWIPLSRFVRPFSLGRDGF